MSIRSRWENSHQNQNPNPFGTKRPKNPNSVDSLNECKYWHSQTISEIEQLMKDIQKPGLPARDYKDMNDDINMYLRDLDRWKARVHKLGGTVAKRTYLSNSQSAISGSKRGYLYFGKARELPGVKAILQETEEEEYDKYNVVELHKLVDASYFGLDDDSTLIDEEEEQESILRKALISQFEEDNVLSKS